MFESFTLSTNIAGDCVPPFVNNANKNTCAYIIPGNAYMADKHVFTAQLSGVCTTTEDRDGNADGMSNGVCYDVPIAGQNLFNS